MKQIVIIGGGFAGLWSALSAIRLIRMHGLNGQVEVTLVNKDNYHGLRPRYYENDLDSTRVPLEKYLTPLGVNLVIGDVTHIDHLNQKVTLNHEQDITYDRLVLATGSRLCTPTIPGFNDYAFNVDTFQSASKLKSHIESLPQKSPSGRYTVIVVGGSFTGIEVATELMDRLKAIAPNNEARVIVIDRSKLASRFSDQMRTVIANAVDEMGIETISNAQIKSINASGIELDSGEIIETQTVVWAAGMQANPLTGVFGLNLDNSGRLPVNRHLKIQGVKHCFAAGDVAAATTDGTHGALLSCQHAMPQGRVAGHNVVADLFGLELIQYEQLKYVTCLDLGSWGAVYAEGWDQQVVSVKEAAKKTKLFINHDRINPALYDSVEKLLEAAEPVFKQIKISG